MWASLPPSGHGMQSETAAAACSERAGPAGRRAPGGVAEPLARVQGNGCSSISGRGSRASSAVGWTPVRSQKIQDQKNTSQEPLMISAPFRHSFCLGLQAPLAHLCPPDPWANLTTKEDEQQEAVACCFLTHTHTRLFFFLVASVAFHQLQ